MIGIPPNKEATARELWLPSQQWREVRDQYWVVVVVLRVVVPEYGSTVAERVVVVSEVVTGGVGST